MSADTVLKRAPAVLGDETAHFNYYGSALPGPKDHEITRLVEDYRAEGAPERLKIASGLSDTQAGWLGTYAHRMALVAVRTQSPEVLRNGIAGLLMAAKVTDGRESTMTMSVLYRAAQLLGLGEAAFRGAAPDAPDADAERLLLGFLDRADPDRTVEAMGYREETGRNGIIVVHGSQPAPTAW